MIDENQGLDFVLGLKSKFLSPRRTNIVAFLQILPAQRLTQAFSPSWYNDYSFT